jgi:hypothetical protein
MTYALREARQTALGSLPAQTAPHASLNAPGALFAPGSRSTTRSTAPGPRFACMATYRNRRGRRHAVRSAAPPWLSRELQELGEGRPRLTQDRPSVAADWPPTSSACSAAMALPSSACIQPGSRRPLRGCQSEAARHVRVAELLTRICNGFDADQPKYLISLPHP